MRRHSVLALFFAILLSDISHAQSIGDGIDTSGGIIWMPPVQLTDSVTGAAQPKIALTGKDIVHVIWEGGYKENRLPYTRSTDGGRTWLSQRDLVTDPRKFPVGFSNNKIVASGEGSVYILAADNYVDNDHKWLLPLAMTMSTDEGESWQPIRRISQDSTGTVTTAAVLGDTIIACYTAFRNGFSAEVRMQYSTDAGRIWARAIDTLDEWSRIVLSPSAIHLARDRGLDGAMEIAYLQSRDFGESFEEKERLSMIDGNYSLEHDLAGTIVRRDTSLFIAWRETRLGCSGIGGCTISFRESHDNGQVWSPEEIITEKNGGFNPSLAAHNSDVAAVWEQELSFFRTFHIYARIRRADSDSWMPTVDLTPNTPMGNTGEPDVAVSSTGVHVVYYETFPTEPEFRIMYRRGVFQDHIAFLTHVPDEWILVSMSHRNATVKSYASLFSYRGRYVKEEAMVFGRGYWAKPTESGTIMSEGEPVYEDTLSVSAGWNLVGALSVPVAASSVVTEQGEEIASSFYGYANGGYYKAEMLEPGKAYWVKIKTSGKLILNATPQQIAVREG